MGRNGSTLLTSIINSHPEIYCDSEVFWTNKPTSNYFPFLLLKSMERKASLNNKNVYGFKLKLGQVKREIKIKDYEGFIDRLYKKNYKFIYLKRQNNLRIALSLYRAQTEKLYEVKKGQIYHKKKLHIDCKKLEKMIYGFEWESNWEDKVFKKYPRLDLTYEDDLEDPQKHNKTATKIFNYLGLNNAHVETEFIRKSARELKKDIENYDEFITYFENTPYKHYLDY